MKEGIGRSRAGPVEETYQVVVLGLGDGHIVGQARCSVEVMAGSVLGSPSGLLAMLMRNVANCSGTHEFSPGKRISKQYGAASSSRPGHSPTQQGIEIGFSYGYSGHGV